MAGAFCFFSQPERWELSFFVFFATICTYNFQRVIGDLSINRVFKLETRILMVLGFVGLIISAFNLGRLELTTMLVAGILSFAYAVPFIPSSRGKLSLRLLPRLKLWIIVIVWTSILAFLPGMLMSLSLTVLIVFTLQQAFFITALTLPFDIRDLKEDWPEQRTIPQVIGVRKSILLAQTLLIFSGLSSLGIFLSIDIDLKQVILHWVVLIASAIVIRKSDPNKDDLFFTILVDGLILFQGLFFLLSEHYVK